MADFPADKVQTQLNRVLSSPDFAASKKLKQFLSYVVAQTLKDYAVKIAQYAIAVDALGYDKSFDPTTTPNVRVLARRLRRALDQYYSKQGSEDPIRIEIPKGSYTPVFSENHSASRSAVSVECPPPTPGHSPDALSEPSIAVAMFKNLNGKDDYHYLAKGLTLELLTSLTLFAGFRVLGPLVIEEGKKIDFPKIRNEYGAGFILQGWVRSHGSKMRITADLKDTLNGTSLWGRTFDFDMEETSLLEIEDQVAGQVAGIVADGMGIVFRKIKTDTYQKHVGLCDVTHAILKYYYGWMTLLPQDWEQAIEALGDALKRHPDNALLMALLANMYYADAAHDSQMIPDALSKAKKYIHKAIELDPGLQVAQYNLVPLYALLGKTEQCIAAAKKVVAMNPNHARILGGCAVAVTQSGAYNTGLDYIERAMKLNPHYPGWYHFIYYVVNYANENYQEAWTEVQRINIEGLLWHPLLRTAILGKLGRVEEARVYIDDLLQMKPEFPENPREYIRPLFVTDKHVEMIWDGLRKAGIEELR